MHPQELLALIQHAHKAAEAGIFRFEQCMEFAQGRALARIFAVLKAVVCLAPASRRSSSPPDERVDHLLPKSSCSSIAL